MRPVRLHMLLHNMCRHRRRGLSSLRLLLQIHGGKLVVKLLTMHPFLATFWKLSTPP